MNKKIEKVVIIGSGPAGFTAALYAARANLNPLLFEGIPPNISGGQLMTTSKVENFPGFPQGISGSELMALFRKQALRFGTKIKSNNIIKVDLLKDPFVIFSNNEKIKTHSLIVATGASAKLLGLKKESELIKSGGGISACATCDGPFYENLHVGVVGGGDAAVHEAIFLTKFASKVTIINRSSILKSSKIMIQKAKNNSKINWELNTIIIEILTKKIGLLNREIVYAVYLKNIKSNKIEKFNLDGLFIAIGHRPNTKIFENQLLLDKNSYLVTNGTSSTTSVKGVFACGDVKDSVYRQAITAAASGCSAAIDAEKYLESKKI